MASRLFGSPLLLPWLNNTAMEPNQRSSQTTTNKCIHISQDVLLRRYSVSLQNCTSRATSMEGKAIHARLIRTGVQPDAHLWNSLLNMYCKCHKIHSALNVFDEMPDPDVVAWTVLMTGYLLEGKTGQVFRLFSEMQEFGVQPNEFSAATVLKGCSLCLDLEFGQQVHGEIIKLDLLSDVFVGSSLVDLYAKCNKIDLGEKVFARLPRKDNVVLWNALLDGYSCAGDHRRAAKLFWKMFESGVRLDRFAMSNYIKSCVGLSDARQCRSVHCLVIKSGTVLDEFVYSSLIDMYSKCGSVEDAHKVFVIIENPDVVAWSAMISCFYRQGFPYDAIKLFKKMKREGIKPNRFTLAGVASAYIEFEDSRYSGSAHAYIIKVGLDKENAVGNSIINMYMKKGEVGDGSKAFSAISDRDAISWNLLLSGYHSGDTCEQGLRIFSDMLHHYSPNKYSFISILRTCASLSATDYGDQVHAHILKHNLEEDSSIGKALVDMYTKGDCIEKACLIFQRMNEKDVFTWTAIITWLAKNDQGEKAIECFHKMQQEGTSPNEFTLASCLRSSSDLASLDSGLQFHSWVIKSGNHNAFVSSCLIQMYTKCGCLKEAETIFNESTAKDEISWNTMICGYSQHGRAEKALDAFRCMVENGFSPDEVTFIGVLSACSNVGLLEEGKQHFYSLKDFGINPTIDHHACMVNLLGRAGKFDEVERHIDHMKLAPDALIWQTVLGACKIHGNVAMAERAAGELLKLEPHTDSTYVTLSNIYASDRRWNDVKRMRTVMSKAGVKKEPGCSWIQINNQVHIFVAHDKSHSMCKEIYRELEELTEKITLSGYVPQTEYALVDATDDEKRQSLLYHSERLALAFGLINTKYNTPVRIFKNLRTCGDCHTAMKLFSKITCREIIVRDVSRFHHFENGSCSCDDYW